MDQLAADQIDRPEARVEAGLIGEEEDRAHEEQWRELLGSAGFEPVRFEDPALGVYKKVVLRDGKLSGVILVGDTSDSHRYMEWLRSSADSRVLRVASESSSVFARTWPPPEPNIS